MGSILHLVWWGLVMASRVPCCWAERDRQENIFFRHLKPLVAFKAEDNLMKYQQIINLWIVILALRLLDSLRRKGLAEYVVEKLPSWSQVAENPPRGRSRWHWQEGQWLPRIMAMHISKNRTVFNQSCICQATAYSKTSKNPLETKELRLLKCLSFLFSCSEHHKIKLDIFS